VKKRFHQHKLHKGNSSRYTAKKKRKAKKKEERKQEFHRFHNLKTAKHPIDLIPKPKSYIENWSIFCWFIFVLFHLKLSRRGSHVHSLLDCH